MGRCRRSRGAKTRLAVGLVGLVAGCGSFSEAPAPTVADGGADGSNGADGAADTGSPLADGGVPFGDAGTTCFDLTTGTHGFVAYNQAGATFSSDGAGLRLHFPVQGAAGAAAWQRTVDAPASATGARLTFEAVITIPSSNLPVSMWYAGLVTLVNGRPANIGTLSAVHMTLGEGASNNAIVLMETFPDGTANPLEGNTFVGTLHGGASAITATLDVTWSTDPGANLRGQLSPQPEATLDPPGRTLIGARSRVIGLSLGGEAKGQPDLGILYTNVCYTFH
jgi:hypothetical protein